MKLNVLVVGGGGREHALCWKIAQSPMLGKLYAAPGNPGTAEVARNIAIKADQTDALVLFCREFAVDLVVIGPEGPLGAGLADRLRDRGIKVFGPSQAAAEIETDKAFAKRVMKAADVPTAYCLLFDDYDKARMLAHTVGLPAFVKAVGPAEGKGAVKGCTGQEVEQTLREMMVERRFGESGARVIIEQFMDGPEMSVLAPCDGTKFTLWPPTRDHKKAFDGDDGPNTGGMGAIGPVPGVTAQDLEFISRRVMRPTVDHLKQADRPFIGCLYGGLIVPDSGINVLEFNARFGDPETQVYMKLLKSDPLPLLWECASGNLTHEPEWFPGSACCVVAASEGYPGKYEKGHLIQGIKEAEEIPGVTVFQAGTAQDGDKLVTAGGRVLGVTALADTLEEAIDLAYLGMRRIFFKGMHYRTDIGKSSL